MTAKDLLHKILEYQHSWEDPHVKDSKPARLRLEQIESLLDAFGLSKKYINLQVQVQYFIGGRKEELSRARYLNEMNNLEYLTGGEFLKDREEHCNAELSQKIIETVTALHPGMEEYITERRLHIHWLFNNLLHFRRDVYKVTYPVGGMLEGFVAGLEYSFYLQNKLKAIITDNLDEIDETLWLILDPAQRDIEMDELKSKYNYTDHDFDSIDHKWRMENY
ncbi:hypothetical protein NAT51_12465 [Flavobacterium amniphilum]|uniref:hypothetical protein n=1 Tax=Flavobacterium amniphilum TaxID=1834035 RepID=UPI00202ABA07|nr:hypothetical protein [Flavobacterium amniphilum]MCL9805756.1 hypothetical protein [Flavobacterium amniphilum]MCL9806343.1 hypothetical protein [Flavobacterium amniphilum]